MKFWNRALLTGALVVTLTPASAARAAETCSFARGTTRCVAVSVARDVQTHMAYSGCLYGPAGIPGRRVMVYEDTYRVTTTTTTLAHGRSERVFSTSSVVQRELVGSQLLSQTCEAI